MGDFLRERLVIFAIFLAIFLAWQGLKLGGIDLDPGVPLVVALVAWLAFIFIKARRR